MIKAKDIYLIIVIVAISTAFSFAIARFLFKPGSKKLTTEVVDPISADFPLPDKSIFNKNSINPTQLIIIGDGNPKPFSN